MMRTLRNWTLAVATIAAGLATTGQARADFVVGDAGAVFVAAIIPNGTNLADSTTFTFFPAVNNLFVTTASGDLSGYVNSFLSASSLNLANFPAFTLTNGGLSFATASGVITTQSATFLNVVLTGILSVTGYDPTPATLSLTFTQQGTSIAGSAALVAVPEPASVLMVCIGGVGLIGLATRRRLQVRPAV